MKGREWRIIAHQGLKEVLRVLRQKVIVTRQQAEENVPDETRITLTSRQVADAWLVEKDDGSGVFTVERDKIEKFARRTNFDNYEGVNRLRDIMKKLGITHELISKRCNGESIIRIADKDFTLIEQ